MNFLPLPDNYLLPVVGCAFLVVVAGIAIFLIRQRQHRTEQNPVTQSQNRQKFAYQPALKPVLILPEIRKSTVLWNTRPRSTVKNIDLVRDRKDLADSLVALTEKYSLHAFTLATRDGLIIATTDPDAATADAARYADMFVNAPLYETPGVVLFGLAHKGSDLVGIIRANKGLSDEIGQNIEDDTKDILNSWI